MKDSALAKIVAVAGNGCRICRRNERYEDCSCLKTFWECHIGENRKVLQLCLCLCMTVNFSWIWRPKVLYIYHCVLWQLPGRDRGLDLGPDSSRFASVGYLACPMRPSFVQSFGRGLGRAHSWRKGLPSLLGHCRERIPSLCRWDKDMCCCRIRSYQSWPFQIRSHCLSTLWPHTL